MSLRYLLDTHAFIWLTTDDAALTEGLRRRFRDPRNDFYLSVASAWEMAIKSSLGKLELTLPLSDYLEEQIEQTGVVVLDVTLPHALAVAALPFHHRDPFDRLLVAQALHEELVLISRDAVFDAYPVERFW